MEASLFSFNLGYWVLQSLAMIATALLIPRLTITSIFGAIGIVIAIAFVNSKLWDAALFFHLPDTFSVQAGLLLLVNGLIFWLLVKLLPGIEVQGLLPAVAAPVVFAICSMLIGAFAADIDWRAVLDGSISLLEEIRLFFRELAGQFKNSSP